MKNPGDAWTNADRYLPLLILVSSPLVTVICVCHNHERFVLEALMSVTSQSYKPVQLLIVDDASTDRSKNIILEFIEGRPGVEFISHTANQGICKAFNSGLFLARGEFVIDFAADDVLLPDRIEVGVTEFSKHGPEFGVEFGDAIFIDEDGGPIGNHSDRFPHHLVPQGDIYEQLIRRYFVDGPTTMVRRRVFDELGGYDENLAYEDFDFWIRSSRNYKYFYTPRALVRQRLVKGGLHEKQFVRGGNHARSTLAVCRKILSLNRTKGEQQALSSRILYEVRQSAMRADVSLALDYLALWNQNRTWRSLVKNTGDGGR